MGFFEAYSTISDLKETYSIAELRTTAVPDSPLFPGAKESFARLIALGP